MWRKIFFTLLALGAMASYAPAANLNFINLLSNVTIQADTDWRAFTIQGSSGNLSFNGSYIALKPRAVAGAVVYVVNPGTTTVAAKITMTFNSDGTEEFVSGTFLAAPAAGNLGTLPTGFTGVPADPATLVNILNAFEDPNTHAPVTFPSNIAIQVQSQLALAITSPSTLPAADLCIASSAVVCSSYSFTFTASGSTPITWSITSGAVPLALNSTTGILSGIISDPAVLQNNRPFFLVGASNSAGSTNQNPSLLINSQMIQQRSAPTSLPNGIQGAPYSTAFRNPIGGTPPYTWTATQAGSLAFPASLVPFTSVVSITGPTASGDRLILGNASSAAILQNMPSPNLPGGHEVFADASIQLAPGQSFSNVYVPTAAERNGDFSDFPLPIIDPLSGVAFPNNIIPESRLFGLYAFRVASGRLPAGLAMSSTGVLSGTPATPGTFALPVQVTDSAGGPTTLLANLPLVVIPKLIPTPVPNLPTAEVSQPYAFTFTATGGSGNYSWGVNSDGSPLPPGLKLSAGGMLSGAPVTPNASAATYNVLLTVTDGTQFANLPVTLVVEPRVTILTASPLPAGQFEVPYSTTLAASPGVAPFTWSLPAGSLPPQGLNLASSGVISGKPTTTTGVTPSTFIAQVTDALGATATKSFQLSVSAAVPDITITVPDSVTANSQQAVVVSASSAYPTDIVGTLNLTFTSSVGAKDENVVFMANASNQLCFIIPATSTTALFYTSTQSCATTPPAYVSAIFGSGTTAGTIGLSVSGLTSASQSFTILPAPQSLSITPGPPQIVTGQITATRNGTNGLTVAVTGFCTARQVTSAKFSFTGSARLKTQSLVIDTTGLFAGWYGNIASPITGSQFTYTESFVISGNPSDIASVSVVLSSPQGGSQQVTATLK